MNTSISKDGFKIIPNILFIIQFGVIFVSRLPQFEGVHFLYGQALLATYSLWYIRRHTKSVILTQYLKIYKIYAVLFILSFLIIQNCEMREVINGVIAMPVIPLLLYFFRISNWATLGLYAAVTGYIIAVITTGIVPIDEVTYNSANFLPYYAMLYSYPYYVTCYYEKKDPLIFVSIITLFIALLSMSRGGIISAALIFIFQLCTKINTPGKVKWLYRIGIVCFVIFIINVGVSGEAELFFEASTAKFDAYGMDTRGRSDSYVAYISTLINPFYLLAGSPISDIPYIRDNLEGSVHNSWLSLHSRIGIYSVWILYYVILGIKKLYKFKQYYMFSILAFLLVAGFSNADIAGVMVGGDSYLFFIVIMYLEYKNKINHNFYKK